MSTGGEAKKDVFICHASEDKDEVARPVFEALTSAGISCWFDEVDGEWGRPVFTNINDGLAQSQYVLVILSKNTQTKQWPLLELGAALSSQMASEQVRICPLLVGTDQDLKDILERHQLLKSLQYLRWNGETKRVVDAMLAKLSRQQAPESSTMRAPRQAKVLGKFAAVLLAAGRSSQPKIDGSKMLLSAYHNGVYQPMLFHTMDIFSNFGIPTVVLVGFDGTTVTERIQNRYPRWPVCIRVSRDDGSDLEANTAGTLRKFRDDILAATNGVDNLLFCVGDQPYMNPDTILEFMLHHLEGMCDASLLAADAKGTPLEKSPSTRIAWAGGRVSFTTPSSDAKYYSLSTLLDVGVLILRREAFSCAAEHTGADQVFSQMLLHLPPNNRISVEVNPDPYQFINVKTPDDLKKSPYPKDRFLEIGGLASGEAAESFRLLLAWLEWNVRDRRSRRFEISSLCRGLSLVAEIDTTLLCQSTPACGDCTYRDKHQPWFLSPDTGRYVISKAKELGFKGILFSGGGENLEQDAYENFLSLLRHARSEQLETNLATNGLFLDIAKTEELAGLLSTIRISIPPTTDKYFHAGLVAPNVVRLRNTVNRLSQESSGYVPMKIYMNILLPPGMDETELEALLRMLSTVGADGIRLKPKHEWSGRGFSVNPEHYRDLLAWLNRFMDASSLGVPVTVAKLPGLLAEDVTSRVVPKACWYRDFNPLVLGCDKRIYACCEMKYEDGASGFDYGLVLPSEDNLEHILLPRKEPQPIVRSKCFLGCKGYLVNRDLQYLLNKYEKKRENVFESEEDVRIGSRVLESIPRSVLTN